MDLSIFAPKAHHIGAAEYLRAKLEYEASPYGLKTTLGTEPETVMVLDVRDPEDFLDEHIRGAVNVPAETIVARLAGLPRDKVLVTYCWDMTCALAPKAALELAQKGFRVQFLAGGIAEWKRKGFPVARNAQE
ncbi:MAG: rhodanese-like domain-containing protein [Elusimicrobia bacterium]|nr:rhodanese-like domain-containing protein [Elusimicrobiota bacterium]